MPASTESPLNLVRGPARKPGWAQLIRLGGDRVAILFDELRKSVGKIDGVIERLHYSGTEQRWFVQYRTVDAELFTVRISPGVLEAAMLLSPSEVERLLSTRKLSVTIRDAFRTSASGAGSSSVRFLLKDRRTVRSFASLARAKDRLCLDTRRATHELPLRARKH
jgi:hypothetical protein